MNIWEKFNPKSKENKRESTPLRLQLALEAVKPMIGKLQVKGRENIAQIPIERRVVIAGTHMSDLDMPVIALALANDFNLAISDQSLHHDFSKDPLNYLSNKIAGDSNFIPLDYKEGDEGKIAQFNADNFTAMTDAVESGKDILFAAHNPSKNGSLASGGIGAVYLAQLSHSLILPVCADFKSEEPYITGQTTMKTLKNKPDAEVMIAKPVELGPIPGIEDYKNILDKRKGGERLSDEEIERFKEISRQLREQSEIVMRAIAEMVPEEKKGPYKKS